MEEKEQKRANRRSSMIEFTATDRTDFLGQPKIIEEEPVVDEKPLVTEDPLYEFRFFIWKKNALKLLIFQLSYF